MDRITELLTHAGDVVLDPFTGAGTYGLAALGLGREVIGIEADAGRFALAVDRLEAVAS
jgi:DNA modification methylase